MSEKPDGNDHDGTATDDPFPESDGSQEGTGDGRNPEADEDDVDSEDPFVELEGLDDSEASSEELEEFFEPVETADLDDDAVWEAVFSSDETPSDTDQIETGADAVVPKDQYCKRCEFFSEPPAVACTRPGTEIEELVGVDEFRVSNCPVVVQRGRVRDVFADEQ
jgi:hypothetical protein